MAPFNACGLCVPVNWQDQRPFEFEFEPPTIRPDQPADRPGNVKL